MTTMTDWTPCSYHANEGFSAGGGVLDGKASAICSNCAKATISSLLAAVTVLAELVDGLATIAGKQQPETMDEYFNRMTPTP